MEMKYLFLFLFFFTSGLQAKQVHILFVRHGQTDWNLEKRVQGHTDNPLNATGIEQAKETAEKLKKEHPTISALYSSDLQRAHATALHAAEKFNLPVVKKPAFREINAGSSEGMKIADKVTLYEKSWNLQKTRKERWETTPVPGEETLNQLLARAKGELLNICEEAKDQSKIAIFSHGKTIATLIADLEEKEVHEVHIPNCGIIEFLYDSETAKKIQLTQGT